MFEEEVSSKLSAFPRVTLNKMSRSIFLSLCWGGSGFEIIGVACLGSVVNAGLAPPPAQLSKC